MLGNMSVGKCPRPSSDMTCEWDLMKFRYLKKCVPHVLQFLAHVAPFQALDIDVKIVFLFLNPPLAYQTSETKQVLAWLPDTV